MIETQVDESQIVPSKLDDADSLYRPPINRNANKIENVYPLDVIIPPEILDELKNSAEELLDKDESELE